VSVTVSYDHKQWTNSTYLSVCYSSPYYWRLVHKHWTSVLAVSVFKEQKFGTQQSCQSWSKQLL